MARNSLMGKAVIMKTTSATKKRKNTTEADEGPQAKRPRSTLDAFFSPVVASSVKKDEPGKKDIALSPEQISVLRMVVDEGKNVFFTGSAGTGKSLLLRAIITALRKKYTKEPDAVSVTASTGMAASNIGGMTIHSWGAVSPTVTKIDQQIRCIKTCKPAFQRWKKTKVLVIDEVSMVDGNLLTLLSLLATELRKKTNRPFGGIQVVVTGDFFQLPPVTKGSEEPFFAFESQAWKTVIEHTINLTQVFRQKDNTFVELLNSMRMGTLPPASLSTFANLSRPLPPHPQGLLPTSLYPLRSEVDSSNSTRLAALPGPSLCFTAVDTGKAEPARRGKLLDSLLAPEKVQLRKGAQVMLIRNIDAPRGLVNGTVGLVRGFYSARELGMRAVGAGPAILNLTLVDGVPRRIGSGKENIVSNSGKSGFARGKLTTDAKPTVDIKPTIVVKTTLEAKGSVNVSSDKEVKPQLNPKPYVTGVTIVKSSSDVKPRVSAKDEEQYPLVEFSTPYGTELALLMQDEFRVEDAEGNVLARRMQIPLILAWAMSIHKSQGQTIERVKVNLGRVFEKGQSYVALSRATSLEGLQVLGFHPSKVVAHKKVIEWSKMLVQHDELNYQDRTMNHQPSRRPCDKAEKTDKTS